MKTDTVIRLCPCFEEVIDCEYVKECEMLIIENNTISQKCPKRNIRGINEYHNKK